MQKKIKIAILVIVLLFGFCLVRDFIIKSVIGTVAGNITGAPVHVGVLSLSVIRQSIKISNFRMYNPGGFPKDILVDIPKIGVSCNLGALIKGKTHLKKIDLELKEIIMVKNKEGKLNVNSLKIMEEKEAKAPGKKVKKPAKEMNIQIDLMNLAIGRIVSKDYSVAGEPVVKVYDVNLKKSYKNITSVQQLVTLIIFEPLKAAGMQGLKVYGISALTGVAVLPVTAALTFTGKDYVQTSFRLTMDRVYVAGLELLKQMGVVKRENKVEGIINAQVNGANVTFKLKKVNSTTTEVIVSARKLGLPKRGIASEIIYKLTEKLK